MTDIPRPVGAGGNFEEWGKEDVMQFRCPVCGGALAADGGALRCEKRHAFDLSASGYTNLLPANKTHGKVPGDSKEMVRARRDFLAQGYYACLLSEIADTAAEWIMARRLARPAVIDAGCGEGYYTGGVSARLAREGLEADVAGFDISKFALQIAAKRDKQSRYAVASLFDLPVFEGCADLLLNIFAPYAEEEFARVLKGGGLLLMVVPGRRHLFGLKQVLYQNPYENDEEVYSLRGFQLVGRRHVRQEITLQNGADIHNLFLMTPYYWKSPRETSQRLMQMDRLETEIAFELLLYRRDDCAADRPDGQSFCIE